MNVSNLISGSFASSIPSLYIWKFSVHVLLKPSLKDLEHNLASMWNECSYGSLRHCPPLGLEWKLTFSSPVEVGLNKCMYTYSWLIVLQQKVTQHRKAIILQCFKILVLVFNYSSIRLMFHAKGKSSFWKAFIEPNFFPVNELIQWPNLLSS